LELFTESLHQINHHSLRLERLYQEGDVLCVIEAMKLFNEIESEFSGKIVKILAEDQSPVEFDQPLFIIDPS
jgi:acetyl/propionyl-CoA carboxylase alpha subunit